MPDVLTEIAAALYAAAPGEFVAERTRLAAANPDLAAQVKRLRKPSIAAWVVNLFAAERADRLGQALQLAEQLREAQDDLDAAMLAQLGRERRALTDQLAREAAGLAGDRGERVTPATLEAVQQTLSAAFFDPQAAAAVASGRLVRELEPTGAVELATVVGGGAAAAPAPAQRSTDEVAERRRRRDAERAVHAAESALERARRRRSAARERQQDAEERAERLAARAVELQAELTRVLSEQEQARADAADGRTEGTEADEDVEAAERALAESRAALEKL
ncbi:transposase [Microbacterium sp. NPDC058342]|uniref:transposase n=1 Tax=Microbacterium sp. NPDC058342 TaxID=3346454 RepID=UPI00365CBF65